MIDRKIVKFLIRRGTDAERQQVVFETGELVYATDTKRIYIGDNESLGGNPIFASIKISDGLPLEPSVSDAIYDTITADTFIYTNDGFKPLTNLAPISANITSKVNYLSAAIVSTNANVATLSTNVSTLSTNVDTKINTLSANVLTLSATTLTLSTNVGLLSTNVGLLSTNVSTLSTNVKTLSTNVTNNSSSIGSLTANVSTLSANISTLSAIIVSNSILSGATFSTISTVATASDTFITFLSGSVNYGIRLWKV